MNFSALVVSRFKKSITDRKKLQVKNDGMEEEISDLDELIDGLEYGNRRLKAELKDVAMELHGIDQENNYRCCDEPVYGGDGACIIDKLYCHTFTVCCKCAGCPWIEDC